MDVRPRLGVIVFPGDASAVEMIALPLRSLLYVREKDVPSLEEKYGWKFRTKLGLAVSLVTWFAASVRSLGVSCKIWLVTDGANAGCPVSVLLAGCVIFLEIWAKFRPGMIDAAKLRCCYTQTRRGWRSAAACLPDWRQALGSDFAVANEDSGALFSWQDLPRGGIIDVASESVTTHEEIGS